MSFFCTVVSLLAVISSVSAYPGEIIYGCAPAQKTWMGSYAPWSGEDTKNARLHLTFDDGPEPIHTPIILDVLREYNITATFFLITDQINATTLPIVQRMIAEGHTVGSHSYSHKNLQYENMTLMAEEIDWAETKLAQVLGADYQPKLFRPPFGSLDDRSAKYLKEKGYTIALWSAGCVDWWFTDNNMPLDISTAAMRFGIAEEGGIVCLHDRSEAPADGERLRAFIDAIWNFWDFVDLLTCLDRTDINVNPYLDNKGVAKSSPYAGEIIYGCAPANKTWMGSYAPWSGEDTKNAHLHLTFDDGPEPIHTPIILDILQEYNISATFFLITNQINATTLPIVERMIAEGHTVGSHSYSHKNLQYENMSLMAKEIDWAEADLAEILGSNYQPRLFRPPFGSLDDRSAKYLKDKGYAIALWSAGCVDWWFTDNNMSLDISIAAMRYGVAEEGGIVCMHDRSEAPANGERLRYFIDSIWNYWDFVDLVTCLGRADIPVIQTIVDESQGAGTNILHVFFTVLIAAILSILFV
jgi:peptidoglycan/xylan/chitin deacetylase (PgdA/CDA1 family)